MRVFIGIEFSDDVKKRIITVQNLIKDNSVKGRWKYIGNFHLTLKFIGEASKEKIDTVYGNMRRDIESIKSFNLVTGSLGHFKGNGCLRVVYLKLNDAENNLDKIFKIVEDACSLSGIEKDKRSYTPHITIAQDVLTKREFKELEDQVAALGNISISVNSVSIIKSEQIQNKRVYSTLYNIILKS